MPDLNAQLRAEFEQFRRSTGTPDYLLARADGEYCFAVVNSDWTIWQAATEAARRQHGSAAQAVAWEVKESTGWEPLAACHVEHAKSQGREVRALGVTAPPVADAEGAGSWYFSRVHPTGTILAIEPGGKRHVVKHGDMDSVAGRDLLEAMSDALSRRPAAAAEATELQQALEDFDVERTGDERYDASNFLLNAAQEFWQACHNAGQYGGVQWLTGTGGELLIYTRGEYREQLMRNIAVLDCQKEHKFPPVAAEQPAEYVPEYKTNTDHRGKVTGVTWTNADKRPPVAAEQPAAAGNALTDEKTILSEMSRFYSVDGPIAESRAVMCWNMVAAHLRAAPQAAPGEGLTIDTPDFRKLLGAVEQASEDVAGRGLDPTLYDEAFKALVAHINTAIAAHTRASDGKDGELFTEAQLVAAGRALSDLSAAQCNVDKNDNWDIYGNEFLAEAHAALTAAMQQAASNSAEGAHGEAK